MSQQARPAAWLVHNGKLAPASTASLPLTTQALHYGTGVFEGIRAYPNSVGDSLLLFRAHDHYQRLHRSARLLLLDLDLDVPALVQLTSELLRRIGRREATYVRPILHKLALLPGQRPGVGLRGISTSLSIVTFPLGDYAPSEGLRCCISSWTRPPQSVIPVQAKVTGAYVNSALAREEAAAGGYDDAIQLTIQGEVAEATTSNVFTVHDGLVRTPPLTADILPGITRDTILTLARNVLEYPVAEASLGRTDLLNADEIFLTGTGLGVVPVTEIQGRRVGTGRPGPVGMRLRELYREAVTGRLHEAQAWITTVPVAAPDAPAVPTETAAAVELGGEPSLVEHSGRTL
ncbi:MAG TPA: branched-chain amino acid transaminase [Kineosporiaceae bacterium]